MKKATSTVFEPGTETWIRFAQAKFELVEAERRRFGVPRLARTYHPAPGVAVFVVATEWRGSIRITGGPSNYRLWGTATPPDMAVAVSQSVVAEYTSDFPLPGWSVDLATFAYQDGPDVILVRAEGSLTLPGCEYPHDAQTCFHEVPGAPMATDGKVAVVVPTDPTTTKVAVVARMVDGAWQTEDVPLPPGVAEAAGVDDTAMAAATPDAAGYYEVESSTEVQAQRAPWDTTTYFVFGNSGGDSLGFPLRYRVYVDPYRVGAVYVDVRYWAVSVEGPVTVALGDFDPGPTVSMAYGTYSVGTWTPHQDVWKYDAGAWTRVYEHEVDSSKRTSKYSGIKYDVDVPQYRGGVVEGYSRYAVLTPYQPVFSPQGGFHVASMDHVASVDPDGTLTDSSSGSAGGTSQVFVISLPSSGKGAVYATQADLLVDGVVVVPAHPLDDMNGAPDTVHSDCLTLADVGVEVVQVAAADSPAFRAVTAAGKWRWGPDEADVTDLPDTPVPIMSVRGAVAFAGTDNQTVYRLGEELTVEPPPELPVLWPSRRSDLRFATLDGVYKLSEPADPSDPWPLALVEPFFTNWDYGPPPVPLPDADPEPPVVLTIYGGTLDIVGVGTFTVEEGSGSGFNEDGTLFYQIDEVLGTITASFTVAEMATLSGVDPADVSYILDGSSWTIGGTLAEDPAFAHAVPVESLACFVV